MNEPIYSETHIREWRVNYSNAELKELISEATAKLAKLRQSEVNITIRFEEETQGSPAYNIGPKCYVTIKQDLMPTIAEGKSK